MAAVRTSRSRVGKKSTDIIQSDADVDHLLDPQQPDHGFVAVSALTVAVPFRLEEQTNLVVAADHFRGGTDERRRITDDDLTRRNKGQMHERSLPNGPGQKSIEPYNASDRTTSLTLPLEPHSGCSFLGNPTLCRRRADCG